MKKLILQTILILCIMGLSCNSLFAGDTTPEQGIEFKKLNPTGPNRAPSLYPVSFSGIFFMDEITISTQNYSGEITVQITGVDGSITQTVQISDSENAVIDISSLPEGVYSIEMVTVGKGTFTGEFEVITY